ncbi:MFS transporter [Sulfuriflexus mobilis]|uniref:MFS transporter n=1 Tax=Sulfuriflexus mobilis TaxID=1811807 RepID=UPI000F822B42|nr:MFS transporter [Sulfuriflexus mobilis]
MQRSTGMSPTERRAALSLASIMATRMLGLFMILPVFALHAQDLPDATPLLIGLAIGAYGLTQALLQIPFGMASDHFGRKRVITIGLLLFAAGSVVAAMSDTLTGIIMGRALQGCGAVAAAVMALTADLTREEQRTKAMAVIGMSIGSAFALALVAGPLLNEMIGVKGIFWLTAVLALGGIAVLWLRVPQPEQCSMHRDAELLPGQAGIVLHDKQLLRLDAGILILHTILTATFVVLPLVLRDELGIAAAHHSWVYLPILLLSAVAMVPFIIVAERKRRMKPIFVGAVSVLGLSLLALSQWYTNMSAFVVILWLFFTAFNFLEASLPSLVSKTAPAEKKGTAMGIYSSSQFFGAFLGGGVGGWAYGEFGVSGVFIFCAAMVGLWWLLAVSMQAPRYLSNLVRHLAEDERRSAEVLAGDLRAIGGVREAVVVPEERAVYLKVDSQRLDQAALDTCLAGE